MECLQDCAEIRQHLKISKKAQVDALHKFIFEQEGDRNNRKRLREFTGFEFGEADPQYANKITYVAENLSTADLISICGLLGLDHNGRDVYERIFKNLCRNTFLVDLTEAAEREEEEDEEEADENDEERRNVGDVQEKMLNVSIPISNRTSNQSLNSVYRERSPLRINPRFSFNFRDVENSIRTFDGTGNAPVEIGFEEFNEMAILMGWDQLQKMIFAKRSLKAIAKFYVMGERGLTSWQKLRDALLNEFGRRVDSEQLHEMLRERKMNKDEGLYEYFYTMKDIAAQGVIEESALIQYVIKGIKDIHVNKSILYGATTVKEFKTKLQAYQMFTKESKMHHGGESTNKHNFGKERPFEKKMFNAGKKEFKPVCYKCGGKGHTASNCENGTKCFKCNKFGHIAKECRSKAKDEKTSTVQTVAISEKAEIKENPMHKQVIVADQQCVALFDTGSVVNIINFDFYEDLGKPQMEKSSIILKGFDSKGKGVQPFGKVNLDVIIDEEVFTLEFYVVKNE